MPLLYSVGEKFNLLRRAASLTVGTGTPHSLYPIGNVADDVPGIPFKYTGITPNSAFSCDLNPVLNSGLDTWGGGLATNWTKDITGTGTVTQQSPGAGGGGSAARMNGGASGTAQLRQDIAGKLRAGEWWHFEFQVNIPAACTINLRVYNLHTNKFAKNDGTWTTATQNFLTRTGTTSGSYVTISGEIRLEAYGGSQPSLPTIRLIVITSDNANQDVDEVVCYPGVNFGSIHGHNLDSVVMTLDHSTDNFVANSVTVATFGILRPSFYTYLGTTMVYKRWWRFNTVGSNQTAISIGEAILAQVTEALRNGIYGTETSYLFPQVRNRNSSGRVFVTPLTTDEQRAARIGYEHDASAELAEIRDEWVRRSGGGRWPMVVVPCAGDMVIHGRVDESWAYSTLFATHWEDEILVTESPFPRP